MSIGFRNGDYDFGGPEAGANAPRPADIAQSASATPLPSDAAVKAGGGRGRKRGTAAGQPRREGGVLAPGAMGVADAGGAVAVPATMPAAGGALFLEDRIARHRKNAVLAVLLVVLALFSLLVDSGYNQLFNPAEVVTCYGIWFQQTFAQFFNPADVVPANEILQSGHMAYFRILHRAGTTAMTVLCGAVLAVAGTLFQSAFRNPIASPSMLGVSSAIQLGDVILVLVFGATAPSLLGWRYAICCACVVVVMAVLFACGRLMSGKGRPLNVVNLLLTAMVLTQVIGVFVTYVTMFLFTWELWEIYNNLSEALTVDLSAVGWGALLATSAVGLAPVLLLRFRLNGLNFDDAEMRLLGIDSARLRIIALVCGTVLVMGAQLQMGTVAMLALVVPHVSRMVFGAEFRKQFWGNVLIGASLLTLCRIVVGFVPLINSFLPISVVLNFVVLPFFVWMLATQQRGWEQ